MVVGKFEKGHPKLGGRQKGTPNRTTSEIREYLQRVYDNNLSRLDDDLAKMSPFQRQQILDRLAAKFLPNLNKNEDSSADDNKIEINITFGADNAASDDDDIDLDDDDKNDDDED
ncbi:MAG: hypothetical protein EOO89_14335 [Pedobacter sp.]|nr:MAG: hypothetical protein EOO89_14335 [Pedobacter sp.]